MLGATRALHTSDTREVLCSRRKGVCNGSTSLKVLGHRWGSCGISFIPLSDSVCLRDLVPYLVNYLYCF